MHMMEKFSGQAKNEQIYCCFNHLTMFVTVVISYSGVAYSYWSSVINKLRYSSRQFVAITTYANRI